jgi:UDPglucose--hexose-1-phosphate uridylyltransferase
LVCLGDILSDFRYNKLTREWVLFAPNRAKRTQNNYKQLQDKCSQNCPFGKGDEALTPNEVFRIGDEHGWRCRVVPNLYNALSINQPIQSYKTFNFENRSGFGAHEVVIETPKHHRQMYHFETNELFDYFITLKLRLLDLKKDSRLQYFSIFKNHGMDAGASQEHSHSQIIATPFIPRSLQDDLVYFQEHKKQTERDFFDDLLYDEKLFAKGILKENNFFIAYCPYASKYPFEVIIMAKEKLSSIVKLEESHLYALSDITHFIFRQLHKALGEFPFNMLIKNGDIQNENSVNRFHIQILPRLYKNAGFEIDTEIFINTFLPEDVVEILKES